MARSRIRIIVLAVFAAPFALLLAALVSAAFMFLTFTDRWNKPTDFAAQFTALTRSQLGLGPNESAATAQWNSIIADVVEAHRANVDGFISANGSWSWPSQIFDNDATEADVELRDRILASLDQARTFQRIDALAVDPRVVIEPASGDMFFDQGPRVMAHRQIVRILTWRIERALSADHVDAAIADLSRIATLARVSQSTPTILSSLVTISIIANVYNFAVAICESPAITAEQAAQVASIVAATKRGPVQHALEGERLAALHMLNARMKPGILIPMDSRSQMHKIDDLFNQIIAQSALTLDQRRARPGSLGISNRWTKLEQLRFPSGAIMEPSLGKVLEAEDRNRAERAGTIITIAILRYRLDHGAALPTSLDTLVPTYLPELPIDPFSGTPPHYVKGPIAVPQSGAELKQAMPQITAPFMLYSVGYDAADNAAKLGFDPSDALREKGAGLDYILYPRPVHK